MPIRKKGQVVPPRLGRMYRKACAAIQPRVDRPIKDADRNRRPKHWAMDFVHNQLAIGPPRRLFNRTHVGINIALRIPLKIAFPKIVEQYFQVLTIERWSNF